MTTEEQVKRELLRLFGEDASGTSSTYIQTLQVLRRLALDARQENISRSCTLSGPALVALYVREAAVYTDVAHEVSRAATKIRDLLEGFTPPRNVEEEDGPCNS